MRWLQLVFLEDWSYATGQAPHRRAPYFPDCPTTAPIPVQILASGPDEPWQAIHKLYFAAIAVGAHRACSSPPPTSSPTRPMLTALITAALRGVDVRILVPRRSDSRTVTAAARSYFGELLAAGVRVFEYTAGMMHSKTLVVDDAFAAVGTANMDSRSFRLNYEVTAVRYDAAGADALADGVRAGPREGAGGRPGRAGQREAAGAGSTRRGPGSSRRCSDQYGQAPVQLACRHAVMAPKAGWAIGKLCAQASRHGLVPPSNATGGQFCWQFA